MKILVTGLTGRMCGNERWAKKKPLYGRMQAIMYADEFDAMGHDVSQYLPAWDEPLDSYDKIFVGIAPLSSLSANNFVEMGRVLRLHPEKAVLYVEDWSVENLTRDWTGKLADEGWRKHLIWKGYLKTDQPGLDEARRGLLSVINGLKCPYPVVASMFPWGDHGALMGESYEVVAWDVSPLIAKPAINDPSKFANMWVNDCKERCWVLGALSDQSRWVDKHQFQWPVLQYGHRSSGQPRLDELDLVQKYADHWGVLCPPYKKSGTGWWRNRYNWAAHVKSVLFCGEDDGAVMDSSYQNSREFYEGADDNALMQAAEAQKEWFDSRVWTREQFRDEAASLLNRS